MLHSLSKINWRFICVSCTRLRNTFTFINFEKFKDIARDDLKRQKCYKARKSNRISYFSDSRKTVVIQKLKHTSSSHTNLKSTCFPTSIYLFKVNNEKTRKMREICSKLIIKFDKMRHCLSPHISTLYPQISPLFY